LDDVTIRKKYIKLFRDNGFNCFPIKRHDKPTDTEPKKADDRYKASKTLCNQVIKDEENYGVIPLFNSGTAIIDLDHKEEYREFAEENIKNGFMVIETGKGWHIPVKGLSGNIKKTLLYNYKIKPDKQIIEIQGSDHYVVGLGSIIFHDKLKKIVIYENKGTDVIWDAKGKDFHHLIDSICKSCNVTPPDKNSRSSYKHLRDRFTEGKPPGKGQSNDYFNQAAIVCNTDGLSQDEAKKRIQKIYDIWGSSSAFSSRPWSNIEAKIKEVYDNNYTLAVGRPKSREEDIIPLIVNKLLSEKRLYSDVDTGELFEVNNGFLQLINKKLQKELQPQHQQLEKGEYQDIIFKLVGMSADLPPTNIHYYAFKNGILDIRNKQLVESDELADMGFPDFNYLSKTAQNRPTKFLQVAFGDIPAEEHPRVKAALRAALVNIVDSVISITHGGSGVGKSAMLEIVAYCLGEYAMVSEFTQFVKDGFIRAKTRGKRLLIFQDMPKKYSDFSILKTLTGERLKSERGFFQDMVEFPNKIKIWGSANYLAKIPEDEKDPMYGRRLSLIHNKRTEKFDEDPEFPYNTFKEEGEKIISWIFNLSNEECKYETPKTLKQEWEDLAEAETTWLKKHYRPSLDTITQYSVIGLVDLFKEQTSKPTDLENMEESLKELGYAIRRNIVTNLEEIIQDPNEAKSSIPIKGDLDAYDT